MFLLSNILFIEPYVCTGNFQLDFRRLCLRNQMTEVPEVKQRPHRPQSPPPQPILEEKTKPGKGGKDKNQPPPPPEPEPEIQPVNENGGMFCIHAWILLKYGCL